VAKFRRTNRTLIRHRTRSGRYYTTYRSRHAKPIFGVFLTCACLVAAPLTCGLSMVVPFLFAFSSTGVLSKQGPRRKGLDTGTRELRSYAELVEASRSLN
jgi:hypothetical protein